MKWLKNAHKLSIWHCCYFLENVRTPFQVLYFYRRISSLFIYPKKYWVAIVLTIDKFLAVIVRTDAPAHFDHCTFLSFYVASIISRHSNWNGWTNELEKFSIPLSEQHANVIGWPVWFSHLVLKLRSSRQNSNVTWKIKLCMYVVDHMIIIKIIIKKNTWCNLLASEFSEISVIINCLLIYISVPCRPFD